MDGDAGSGVETKGGTQVLEGQVIERHQNLADVNDS